MHTSVHADHGCAWTVAVHAMPAADTARITSESRSGCTSGANASSLRTSTVSKGGRVASTPTVQLTQTGGFESSAPSRATRCSSVSHGGDDEIDEFGMDDSALLSVDLDSLVSKNSVLSLGRRARV